MKIFLKVILLLGSFFNFWPAMAVPTLYPKSNPYLTNNTNSSVVADTDNLRKFYVLPPNVVDVQVMSLNSVTANTGFCKEISDIQKYNADTLQLLNNLKQQEYGLLQQITAYEAKVRTAELQLGEYVRTKNLQDLADIDKQDKEISKRISILYDALAACRGDCSPITSEMDSLNQTLQDNLTKISQIVSRKSIESAEYTRQKNALEDLENQKQISIENVRKVQADFKDMYHDFVSMYDAHSQREGAKISVQYDSGWTRNVGRLQFDNPNYYFEKMPTEKAVVRADAYGKNNLVPGSSIIAFNFGGIGNIDGPVSLESYPESFTGTATLNLLAACPIMYPQFFGMAMNDDRVNPQKMKFGLIVGYQYPAQFEFNLTMKYNMYKLYELTEDKGSKGGFFGSKSWDNKEENEYYKDGFDVEWESQSAQLTLTQEQKAAIESDLRRQVLSRMASFMVLTNPPRLGTAPDPSQPGALVLSDSLSKTCGVNLTCKGASMALRLIYDIFSSSNITESYKQKINVEITERYANKQMLMQPMLTTYQ